MNGASLNRFLNGPFVKTGRCQTAQNKGTQSNTLCSGFGSKNPLMGFLILFSTHNYAGIGTKCV